MVGAVGAAMCRRGRIVASVSSLTLAVMQAIEALLSASEDAGPTSAFRLGGGAGSGGPWVMKKLAGDPEAVRGM